MQDDMRLQFLKEKDKALNYSSKPKLNETKILLTQPRTRPNNRSQSARDTSRPRSASESSFYENKPKDKYSHVKPKTLTRLPMQTARTDAEFLTKTLSGSKQDLMNDSSSIRFL
jgi:hypothetical protein